MKTEGTPRRISGIFAQPRNSHSISDRCQLRAANGQECAEPNLLFLLWSQRWPSVTVGRGDSPERVRTIGQGEGYREGGAGWGHHDCVISPGFNGLCDLVPHMLIGQVVGWMAFDVQGIHGTVQEVAQLHRVEPTGIASIKIK